MLLIDIGTAYIKVVDTATGRRGILESPQILQSSVLAPLEGVIADYLSQLLRAMGVAAREIILALPTAAMLLGPDVHQSRYRAIAERLGLRVRGFVAEGEALARRLPPAASTSLLVVDLGAHATNFYYIKWGALRAVSHTDFSLGTLAAAASDPMFPIVREAVWDVIIREARLASDGAAAVMVLGGGASLPGVTDFFTQQLGMQPVPLPGIDPVFVVAEGLAPRV